MGNPPHTGLAILLARVGVDAVAAATPADALDLLEEPTIALVVFGATRPLPDGHLADVARARHPHLRIVYGSFWGKERTRARAGDHHVDGWLDSDALNAHLGTDEGVAAIARAIVGDGRGGAPVELLPLPLTPPPPSGDDPGLDRC